MTQSSTVPEYILAENLAKTDLYQEIGQVSNHDYNQVEVELLQLSAECIRLVDISRKIATDMARLALSLQEQP